MRNLTYLSAGLFSVCLVIFAFIIIKAELNLTNLIKEQNRLTEVHLMLPPNADCAVKVMYFRDKDGKLLEPSVSKVCHWKTGLNQKLKPKTDPLGKKHKEITQ